MQEHKCLVMGLSVPGQSPVSLGHLLSNPEAQEADLQHLLLGRDATHFVINLSPLL